MLLARDLGKSERELGECMTWLEFVHWMAFYSIEREQMEEGMAGGGKTPRTPQKRAQKMALEALRYAKGK